MNTTAERMMKELWMWLGHMVEAGEMTAEQANEWADMKAEQWKDGV